MKILQVVTLMSPDAAYGGPVTVAMNQCAALAARGHQVTLASAVPAGHRPRGPVGVDLRTFRVRPVGPGGSLTRIAAPTMVRWLRGSAADYDVAHVHLGRDFVSAPAARTIQMSGTRLHVQTHGMIAPRAALPQRMFDAALVRPVLDAAESVFYLNGTELTTLRAAAGDRRPYRHLTNGMAVPAEPVEETWPEIPEVLFLGRLHARKRPAVFARSAAALVASGRRARFTVVGPDEGEAGAVDEAFAAVTGTDAQLLSREPAEAPHRVLDRMRRARIYVLASVDEPLPMSVLEAMSLGLPVVVTDSCGFATAVAKAEAGIVVGAAEAELTAAIARLLDDPAAAREMGRRGRLLVAERFSIGAVADELERRYAGVPTGSQARQAAAPTEYPAMPKQQSGGVDHATWKGK
ncbi:glycosyltransferase [Gordonia phosphorivorans]|uniref:Glycosyltransferase n=1 Tax=Gordonia phosphorivorans TaxID=1056982 RepID=A0ABV6H565_9ACTN